MSAEIFDYCDYLTGRSADPGPEYATRTPDRTTATASNWWLSRSTGFVRSARCLIGPAGCFVGSTGCVFRDDIDEIQLNGSVQSAGGRSVAETAVQIEVVRAEVGVVETDADGSLV